ncbi:hypothetical protein D3C85_801300 [compost metagenome]
MVWQWIERLTHLSFLLLAVVLVVKLSSSGLDNSDLKAFSLEVSSLKTEIQNTTSSNLAYSEERVNKLSRAQDSYQTSTINRIYLIEGRVAALESENKQLKQQQKTIINNSNVVHN